MKLSILLSCIAFTLAVHRSRHYIGLQCTLYWQHVLHCTFLQFLCHCNVFLLCSEADTFVSVWNVQYVAIYFWCMPLYGLAHVHKLGKILGHPRSQHWGNGVVRSVPEFASSRWAATGVWGGVHVKLLKFHMQILTLQQGLGTALTTSQKFYFVIYTGVFRHFLKNFSHTWQSVVTSWPIIRGHCPLTKLLEGS